MATTLAVIVLAFLVSESTSFSLVVDDPYQILPPGKVIERFMCQADVPLTGCQVMTFGNSKIFDLSNGSLSNYYWGTGLENGQCGLSVERERRADSTTPYGCRARTLDGDWAYETIVRDYLDYSFSILPILAGPRTVIANPGSNVTFTVAAGEPLSRCSCVGLDHQRTSSGSGYDYSFGESKLHQGLCSLTLLYVRPEASGIIMSKIESVTTYGTIRYHKQLTTLIVKMAPAAPELSINYDGDFNEDDVMEASCNVGPTRPVARITWLLNYDVIQGENPDYDTWPWEHEAGNITWKLIRKLSMHDDGKVLVCRVHHIALPGGVVDARRTITVRKMVATEESASRGQRLLRTDSAHSARVVSAESARRQQTKWQEPMTPPSLWYQPPK